MLFATLRFGCKFIIISFMLSKDQSIGEEGMQMKNFILGLAASIFLYGNLFAQITANQFDNFDRRHKSHSDIK